MTLTFVLKHHVIKCIPDCVNDDLPFLFFYGKANRNVGWLVLGLTALLDDISVYIGPSPKERENEERG